ncbi:hypothetical protein [Streptomyces sp. NBC_00083]|uniref:hypothetical protein n=1 Tax=Streptomyces sp. NBC_00083 TaxID=2975647 RepID=UPI002256335E|nr:hypothetical protein [Streptomyces sp. NBC_00083]MCX5381902.1 hypothetical protein [Streptomyces sp. NBC_00083]
MSWDVLLLHLPEGFTSVQELPDSFTPPALGTRHDVLAALGEAVPEADLSDPAWGEIEGPTWSMDLNIGEGEPVDTAMLHIYGSGDDVLVLVLRIARALRCKALDISTGRLLSGPDVAGWHTFQAYRDRVAGGAG